jgi:hypothetical protein
MAIITAPHGSVPRIEQKHVHLHIHHKRIEAHTHLRNNGVAHVLNLLELLVVFVRLCAR